MTRKELIKKTAAERASIATEDKGLRYLDFVNTAEWADKTMIEKACEWLKDNVNDYLDWYDWEECRVNKDNLLYDFRKAMEE